MMVFNIALSLLAGFGIKRLTGEKE